MTILRHARRAARRSLLPAVLALGALGAGCAGSTPKPGAAPRAGDRGASGGPVAEAVSARAQRLFDDAVQALEDQKKLKVPTDWALLERKWRGVVEAGDLAEAHYNLGVALEQQGKLAEARESYQRALQRKPGLRQAAVNLGVLLEKSGDAAGAAQLYAGVIRDFPDDAVSRARLAALYRASGQLDEAWRLAREALLRDPEAVGAYKVLIRVALARNQLDLAKLVALRAAKIDATDPDLPYFTGLVLASSGDDAGAAAQFKKALTLDPGHLPARRALLAAAVKAQAWGGVAEHAKAILQATPDDAPVLLALGIAQRHLGQGDAALASYAQAERLGGDRLPEVHLARAVFYMRVKNACEPAVEEFKAYARVGGPAAGNPVVFKLQRECEEIVVANRQAAEAAKQLQLEAERKAAEDAAKKAVGGDGKTAPNGAPLPTSAAAPVE